MSALLLDGAASAAVLPDSFRALLDGYANPLSRDAVRLQQLSGLAISELLGLVTVTDEGEFACVAETSELRAELLKWLPEREVEHARAFLERPVPHGHLRVILWTPEGVAHVRVDVMPAAKGGAA
jgi:hypothetical protein